MLGLSLRFSRAAMTLALVVAAAGCAPKDVRLPGERLDPRAIIGAGGETGDTAARPVPITLPAAGVNADWTHPNGAASHSAGHPALAAAPARIWTVDIGAGEDRRHRISAQPVVSGGRVFAMDSRATVTAVATSGARLWQADLAAGRDAISGGGLATDGARVYATTGFGDLVALDAASGAELWRQSFDAPIGGAPAVAAGQVFVVARDGSAWAVSAASGRIDWVIAGTPGGSGKVGAGAPAVSGDRVILPFASGEVRSVARADGTALWAEIVVGGRLGRAYATVRDITGDPVIAGNTVYAGSSAGRVVALDLGTGGRRWQAEEGAAAPVWPVGGAVFLVSDENRLIRLDARDGSTVWAVDLPYFTKDKPRRQQRIFAQYGPVLAGGRLWVASAEGALRGFDPVSGALTAEVELPGGAAAGPAVAGGVMYVVSTRGQLHAFR
ncbi:MAG: PQQ-like beta-propeller repeat protein [Rhodobacteraceae bacterium]|nr:PQQ-like beta-propeller repeat protein [Paracoccaceae bacterium]